MMYDADDNTVRLSYVNTEYTEANKAVEDLEAFIAAAPANDNNANRDRLVKLQEIVNGLAGNVAVVLGAIEEVEKWINHAKGHETDDMDDENYKEVNRQAEKCCRAFQHICRGTGAVYDGFMRLAINSYSHVRFHTQAMSVDDRVQVYASCSEIEDRRTIDFSDANKTYMSPFKASKVEISHNFSQPNPIMIWALKHKYLEIGNPPEVRQLMTGDIHRIWQSLCNLLSMVYDRKCALKGFDFAHTLLGFSPVTDRKNVVSDTMYSLFDRMRMGFAQSFIDLGYEMIWHGETITPLTRMGAAPWAVMVMPQRIPVCAWKHFFSNEYMERELSVKSTPTILD